MAVDQNTLELMALGLSTNTEALRRMYSLGLREVHFESLDNKQAWEYAVGYWRDSGFEDAPTEAVMLDKTGLDLDMPDESPVWVANELKERLVATRTRRLVLDSIDELKTDPVEAVRTLSDRLWAIRRQSLARSGESDLVSSIEARRKRYLERMEKSGSGLLGATLGFDEVDEVTGGILPGELWVVAAGPKVGKTWFSLQVTKKAMEAGMTVLYFTLEMPIDDMEDRLEALLSGVSYNRLSKGTLESSEVNRLRETQDAEADMGTVLFRRPVYGERTVENMVRIAKELRPDVMIIDQLSWIEADDAPSRAEQVAQIILDLKAAISDDAEARIPTLLLTQFNRAGASAGEQADLSQLALSSEIERTADAVLAFSRTKEQAANNALVMQVLASRRCDNAKWLLHRELVERSDFSVVRRLDDGQQAG